MSPDSADPMDPAVSPVSNDPTIADSDDRILREVLRRFPVDAARARIDCPPHARGFSGAMIRRITTDDVLFGSSQSAVYCLRGWPRESLPHQRILELHRFLYFVRDQGFEAIAAPIPALDGSTLVSHKGRAWQLEPWMPGAADFHASPHDERLRSVMNVLARFHRIAATYHPTAEGRDWFANHVSAPSPAVRERMALVNGWSAQRLNGAAQCLRGDNDDRFRELGGELIECFRASREQLRIRLSDLSETAVPLQPCLRDVWHDHILFVNDEVSGIVDPSATRTENVASDLSRLLGSLLGKHGERWDAALETYRQTRSLSPEEHRLVRLLDDSGVLLSGMTWIDRRIDGEIPADQLPAVVNRLEHLRERMTSL